MFRLHNGSITEAERKQIFHGELFCFPGPFAVIHGEPQSPGGPCPGPGTTTEPRGCDRDPDPDRPPSQELHPVCPCDDIFTGRAGGFEGTPLGVRFYLFVISPV